MPSPNQNSQEMNAWLAKLNESAFGVSHEFGTFEDYPDVSSDSMNADCESPGSLDSDT